MNERDFVEKWAAEISSDLGKFPQDYVNITNFKEVPIKAKALKIGSEFFGEIEILDSEGNVVYLTKSYAEAKFLLYAFRFSNRIFLPKDDNLISEAVKKYEKKLDGYIVEIKMDFGKYFSDSALLLELTNKIFRKLNLQRH